MTIQFSVEVKGLKGTIRYLNHINKNMPKLGEKIRVRLAKRTKALAKMNVIPNKKWKSSTGELKNSIIYRKESADSTMIIAQAPYAGYVELGTKKHPVPRNPFRRTWTTAPLHPGAKPMKYMEKAYRQIVKEAPGHINDEVEKYFARKG